MICLYSRPVWPLKSKECAQINQINQQWSIKFEHSQSIHEEDSTKLWRPDYQILICSTRTPECTLVQQTYSKRKIMVWVRGHGSFHADGCSLWSSPAWFLSLYLWTFMLFSPLQCPVKSLIAMAIKLLSLYVRGDVRRLLHINKSPVFVLLLPSGKEELCSWRQTCGMSSGRLTVDSWIVCSAIR